VTSHKHFKLATMQYCVLKDFPNQIAAYLGHIFSRERSSTGSNDCFVVVLVVVVLVFGIFQNQIAA
jgi:hypothetical protein